MKSEKATFMGAGGDTLAARLESPEGEIRAYALFAHCFTCSKDIFAASRIAAALASSGIATLRFDFTGLGASGGDFANTNFSSNVDDLVAAADWLRAEHAAPSILIGHSLGGAAVARRRRGGRGGGGRRDHRRAERSGPCLPPVRRQHRDHRAPRRGGREDRGTPLPHPKAVPRRHRRAAPAGPGGGPPQGIAGHARAARPHGGDRQRGGDIPGGETPQELRLPRQRGPPADETRGRGLRGRGSGCLGEPVPSARACACRCSGGGRRGGGGERDRAVRTGHRGWRPPPDRGRALRRSAAWIGVLRLTSFCLPRSEPALR